LGQGGEDKLCWPLSKGGVFDVRLLYNVLVPHDGSPFPWKCIWRSKVSLKAAFFAWSAALGKIITLDNLRKRHVLVVDWYYMCKRSGESADHLLLRNEVSSAIWSVIFGHRGLSWVMFSQVVELFACWRELYGSPQSAVVWKIVSSCLLWCLWRKMNERSFVDRERMVVELKCFFFNTLFLWTTALDFPSLLDFHFFSLSS
jgi:hypothetical protein